MPKNRQKGKVMKDKFKNLGKRIAAVLLSVLTTVMMFPISAFAASENLGAVSGMKELDVIILLSIRFHLLTAKDVEKKLGLFFVTK